MPGTGFLGNESLRFRGVGSGFLSTARGLRRRRWLLSRCLVHGWDSGTVDSRCWRVGPTVRLLLELFAGETDCTEDRFAEAQAEAWQGQAVLACTYCLQSSSLEEQLLGHRSVPLEMRQG